MLKKIIVAIIIGFIILVIIVLNTMLLTNERIINYVKEDLLANKDDYTKITMLINKLPISIDESYSIRKPPKLDDLVISIEVFYPAIELDSNKYELKKLIKNSYFYYFVEQGNWVCFKYPIRNREFVDIRLIYFYHGTKNLKNLYPKLQIGWQNNIPSNSSDWIYIIDKNWAIYLPEATFLNLNESKYPIGRNS